MGRAQLALLLLGLCLLHQLVPPDWRGCLVLATLAALPLAALLARRWPERPLELLGALLSAIALCGLALESPERRYPAVGELAATEPYLRATAANISAGLRRHRPTRARRRVACRLERLRDRPAPCPARRRA
jgi:hypothetical protein